jgi:uncharacterized protein YdeI (YjbR/CyaY-like superfamily)
MPETDPRIDLYIAKSADFAQPLLAHLRKLVHATCPGVTETIKWGFPHFEYKGSILASMASFKNYCSFSFWKATIMDDPHQILKTVGKTSMGHFGQMTGMEDLPGDKIIKAYIKEAMRLNEEGTKIPAVKKRTVKKPAVPPPYFLTALKKHKKALTTFESFSDSNKRDYIEWLEEAKTEATRDKRLATSIEWLSEGKARHWKYVKK